MILAWILAFSGAAMAAPFISGKDAKEGGFEASCRVKLTITEPNGDYKFWICSGTLVKPNEVIYASHCTDKIAKGKSKIEVKCGWIGSVDDAEEVHGAGNAATDLPKTRPGEVFLETHAVKEVYRFDRARQTAQKGDQSRLILSTDSKLNPITPLKKSELANYFEMPMTQDGPMKSKPGVECEIQGYGEDNDNRMGRLHRAVIDPNSMQKGSFELLQITDMTPKGKAFQESCVALYQSTIRPDPNFPAPEWLQFINRWGFTGERTRPGDSGGGLFCKKFPSEEYRLVGTCRGGLAYPKKLTDGRWVMHDSVTWHPIETDHWQKLTNYP